MVVRLPLFIEQHVSAACFLAFGAPKALVLQVVDVELRHIFVVKFVPLLVNLHVGIVVARLSRPRMHQDAGQFVLRL